LPARRWARTEAAQKIPTVGGPLRAPFERIAERWRRNIAKVAVARRVLTLCYHGLGTTAPCLRRRAAAAAASAD